MRRKRKPFRQQRGRLRGNAGEFVLMGDVEDGIRLEGEDHPLNPNQSLRSPLHPDAEVQDFVAVGSPRPAIEQFFEDAGADLVIRDAIAHHDARPDDGNSFRPRRA